MKRVLLPTVLTSLTILVLGRVAPDGYDTIPNSPSPTSSYKFHFEDKTWEEANVICQEEGAHLIVIDSEEEANILYLLRESQEKKQYHVGMHTKGHWNDWVTVLGDSIEDAIENNWLPGEPTPDEHCGTIQLPDKRYNNVRCNFAKLPFICEKQPTTQNRIQPAASLQCIPEGYITPNVSKPTSSYKTHLEGRTWEEANVICEEEGGYLVVVNSAAEMQFLTQLRGIQENGHDLKRRQFYVGMHCKGRWGQWVSVLGDPVAKTVTENWLQGEPTPDEHCGAIQLPDKHFNNIRCNFESMPFICEKPIGRTNTKLALPGLKPCTQDSYETVPNSANLFSTYKFHVELKTWEEANLICHEEGAHLVVVNSQAEAKLLDRLRRNLGDGDGRQLFFLHRPEFPLQYHVGLHCKGHKGYWVDVLGISANQSGFNRWLQGSPSQNAHCGAIQLPAKRFNDVKCNFENLPFICEKEPVGANSIPVPIAKAPKIAACAPNGYVTPHGSTLQTSSYKVHYERRTWEEANLICQEEDGHLLVVETEAEADMLHQLLKSQEKTQFLIGINCKGRWSEWVTVLGNSIVKSGGYNKWLAGEPTPDEHCGTIQLPDKRYNNVRCNFATAPFICEKKTEEAKVASTQLPCLPPGYVTFSNLSSSYKLHKEFVSWEEANVICEEEAAHLVVVDSMEEAENLATLREGGDGDEFHVGMHCKGRWGDWVTVLGGTVSKSGYNEWLDGEPSSQEYCGAIELNEKLFINIRCNTYPLPFICEKPAPVPAPVLPAPVPAFPAPKCPTDTYETIFSSNTTFGSSYKLHRERVTWDVANFACEREGAHLVVIDSKTESNFVALLFGRVPSLTPPHRGYDLVHVGITDRKREGRWRTVLGDPFAPSVYAAWREGEPDNRGGLEHCAGMSRDKLLEDIQCNNMVDVYPFVCEMKN